MRALDPDPYVPSKTAKAAARELKAIRKAATISRLLSRVIDDTITMMEDSEDDSDGDTTEQEKNDRLDPKTRESLPKDAAAPLIARVSGGPLEKGQSFAQGSELDKQTRTQSEGEDTFRWQNMVQDPPASGMDDTVSRDGQTKALETEGGARQSTGTQADAKAKQWKMETGEEDTTTSHNDQ